MKISTVALAVIGDEILLGEVKDLNIHLVSREVFRIGADLSSACVLPDDPDFMFEHLSWMMKRFDWIVTTGGIGATHDDLTKQVVSRITGKTLVEAPEAIKALEKRAGSPLSGRIRDLALVPEGAELVMNDKSAAPAFVIDNLLVLPGIPDLVESMIGVIGRLMKGSTFHTATIRTMQRESEVADLVESVQSQFTEVKIGSYPVLEISDYKVRIVLRSRDPAALGEVEKVLLERMENEPGSTRRNR